jgi:hypothetical protein
MESASVIFFFFVNVALLRRWLKRPERDADVIGSKIGLGTSKRL